MNEYAIIIGSMMLGFYIPEALSAIAKVKINITSNLYAMIAVGLIVGGLVL